MAKKELFPKLTLEEKRTLINLNEWYLEGVLSSREGKTEIVDTEQKYDFIEKLDDEEIKEALELLRLSAEGERASNPKDALKIFQKLAKRAPFDSIALLSIGVCYANLGNGKEAVSYVEKALEIDPENERIKENLEGIKQHFGL
jgi:tetratricopeptide (TPR) repeat protein